MTALSAKLAEVLRLIAEMDATSPLPWGNPTASKARTEAEQAAVNLVRDPELAGLVRDAERYRWLREHWGYVECHLDHETSHFVRQMVLGADRRPVDSDSLDAAIDAAKAALSRRRSGRR